MAARAASPPASPMIAAARLIAPQPARARLGGTDARVLAPPLVRRASGAE